LRTARLTNRSVLSRPWRLIDVMFDGSAMW
jgi:hypothetical protein